MCPRLAARDALFLQEPMQIATLVNTINSRGGKRGREGNGESVRREGHEGLFETTLRTLARILSGFNKASRQVAVFGAANTPSPSPKHLMSMLLKLTFLCLMVVWAPKRVTKVAYHRHAGRNMSLASRTQSRGLWCLFGSLGDGMAEREHVRHPKTRDEEAIKVTLSASSNRKL